MAITAAFRQQVGTAKTIKSSGGDATMTPTSLASGSYWQSTKVDLGATFAARYRVEINAEWAATPTSLNSSQLWANPSSSATAGNDNKGGCSGADAAYTGVSSNAAASVNQLQFIGSAVNTAQATSTVQSMYVGEWCPNARYNSFVFLNGAGSALHSTITNFVITLTPIEPTSEAS